MTEIYLMAVHSFTSVLTNTNKRLQAGAPLIHKLRDECLDLISSCIEKFCKSLDEDVTVIDLDNLRRLEGQFTFMHVCKFSCNFSCCLLMTISEITVQQL